MNYPRLDQKEVIVDFHAPKRMEPAKQPRAFLFEIFRARVRSGGPSASSSVRMKHVNSHCDLVGDHPRGSQCKGLVWNSRRMTKEVQQTLRHLDPNDILLPWAHAMQDQITAACSIGGDQSNPYLICSSKSCFGVDALQYLMTEVKGSQDIDGIDVRYMTILLDW